MCNCRKKRRPVLRPEDVTPPRPAPNAQTAGAQVPREPAPTTSPE